MADKVLINYDITENDRFYPYRMIFYNKQMFAADDSPTASPYDPGTATVAANAPTYQL